MSRRVPRRFLIRYKRPGAKRWRRAPRFITRFTGYRTREQAETVLAQLQVDGFIGHVDTYDHLRVLALASARDLIGVMEQGANNRGPKVDEIIRANGGALGEPWCGDFCAYVYRAAGSRAVTRAWAAVRLLPGVPGLVRVAKRAGEPGDLIRFTFDHVGILEAYCDAAGRPRPRTRATHVKTIEGNTGRTGAVSDSRTGGDGVYRKIRPIGQVSDCVVVTR